MAKMSKKNTASYMEAAKEVKMAPIQLLHEIQALLQKSFIGNFDVENNVINMSFENGQKFKLTIEEVVWKKSK